MWLLLWLLLFVADVVAVCVVVVRVGGAVVGLDHPAPDRPKFRSVFPVPPPFRSFSPSVFSLNFCGFCEDQDPQMCTYGLSGCRVNLRRPQSRRGFTRQPESPNVHIGWPRRLKIPPKFHEKTPRERQKERKWVRQRGKNAKFWAPHPDTHQIQKWIGQDWIGPNWPNQDGQNGIGPNRSLPWKLGTLLGRLRILLAVSRCHHHRSRHGKRGSGSAQGLPSSKLPWEARHLRCHGHRRWHSRWSSVARHRRRRSERGCGRLSRTPCGVLQPW